MCLCFTDKGKCWEQLGEGKWNLGQSQAGLQLAQNKYVPSFIPC